MASSMRSAQETYLMLDRGSIWDTARRCDVLLNEHRVPHAMVGGDLGRSFARHLHKSLRKEFRNLVLRARAAE